MTITKQSAGGSSSWLWWVLPLLTLLLLAGSALLLRRGQKSRRQLERRVAQLSAVSIVNARLYQTERQRRQIADTLHQVASLLNTSLELDHVLHGILEGLAQLVTYDAAAILLREQEDTFILRAARGHPALVEAVGQTWSMANSRRIRLLAETRQAQCFGIDLASGPYHQILDYPYDHSCLGTPILVQDRLIGVLCIDCITPDQYSDQDMALVTTLASQAASVLENARLYATGQEEAWISTALLEVAEATSQFKSVDEILETVVRITPLLVGVDRCAILFWSEDQAVHRVAAAYETTRDETDLQVGQLIAQGDWQLLDRLWKSGSPVVDEFGAIPGAPATLDVETTLLALPLRVQGELTGAMIIGFTGQVAFSEHRIKLIAGIANQTALAVESAQLAVAQQEEAWVSMALLQVAEAVGTLSELDDVLGVITRLTPLLVGVESCLVYLWNAEQQIYVPGASYGLQPNQVDQFQTTLISASQWAAMSFLDLAEGAEVGQGEQRLNSQLSLIPGPPAPVADDLGLCEPFALPLLAWGNLVGALVVDTLDGQSQLSGRRLNILSGVAQQTATAIQNARLYVESIEHQKLERELQLARQIQASFLPDQVPHVSGWDLAAYWQGARQVSGDFYDFVPLGEDGSSQGRWGFVIADVADKGMPAALFMALSRTLVRTMAIGRHDPAEVLTRVNDMILADSRSDLFVTLFYAILNPPDGTLTYANAGHNPPLLFAGHSKDLMPLAAQGMAMGIVPGIEMEQREVKIQPGDVVLFYTDGITDALNAEMDEFGLERLCRVVDAHRTAPAGDVIRAINQAIDEFVGDTPQFDDLTLLVLKRLIPSPA